MEKDIESYLRKRVTAAGGLALKSGGRVCFAELKDTGQKPRKRQLRVHGMLRDLGFTVYVPDSKAAVDKMMEEVVPNEVHTP